MYKAFICVSMVCLLLCVPVAEGKNYAVLISAGVATTDDAAVNSCFWYNPYLQYTTLLEEGYGDDDIYFLYGYGTDFNSSHACYQSPYAVTDYPVSRANIQSVFNTLAGIMTSNDFLYVWWMGHGGPSGGNLVMSIDTTGESVWDYEIADWVGQITDYDVRTFSWMTCYSGGILDDVEGMRSIVMSSATFYESTTDEWLCDTWHAEFHYPERCAWAWETPCGICGSVDADSNDDGRVSFDEAFTYAEANTSWSHPQISDLGGLASDTFLGGCTSQGELALDQAEYACSDDAGIGVLDCDLNTDDEAIESVMVTIDSTTEPGGETVLLTETSPASADFRGAIELNTSDAPGILHITEGDVVTATYIDADDGQGGVNVVVTDTAVVDCTPPQISNVQTASVEPRSATVTFDTDEPTKGTVRYGFVCGALTETATEVGFKTDHTVNLSGLDDNTTYLYAVDAEDEAGNSASDDNGGTCYTLTTPYAPDCFTEEFTGDFDLDNHTVTFIPDGSLEFYCGCREEAAEFPTDPTGGTTLSLGDDDYSAITLSGEATVFLYGIDYETFYVGSNGYITFTAGDGEYWPTLEWHFELPRISALFVDLDPSAGGTISWKQLVDRIAVTWFDVPEYYTSNSNSFQVEMFFDGTVRITWLAIDAASGISGLSEGEGVPPDFVESDLSAYGPCPCDDALRVVPVVGFSSSGIEGGPFTPECMIYTLTNTGDSPLDWAAAGTQAWLDVDPTGGTLAPSDSAPVDVCINTNANSLPAGVHADTVTFTNLISGIAQTRPVELTVEAPEHDVAVISVTPSETVVPQSTPVSIEVTVENQGDLSETFEVTTYYGVSVMPPEDFENIPNGNFEDDPPGTEKDDITDWDYDLVVHLGNPPTGDDLQTVDDYYYSGEKSIYSYLQTTSVAPFPGDSVVSQDLVMEEPLVTHADYITLWVSGDGYTTSSRYYWWIALHLSDGINTYSETLRCDCWGLNEGCTPNHFDYYDELKAGADGNTWKRYTRSIPGDLDKSNLTVTIRHRQKSWDLTQASSWYRLDSIYFSDVDGNPYAQTPIETKVVSNLPPGEQTTLDFTWDTNVAPGEYTLSAYAHPVPGETDMADNTYTDGTVVVELAVIEPPAPVVEYPGNCRKNRFISFLANNTAPVAFQVELTATGPASCYVNDPSGDVGMTWWVTEPVCTDRAGNPVPNVPPDPCTDGNMWRSQLSPDPADGGPFVWPPHGPDDSDVINITDCEIIPIAMYAMRATADPQAPEPIFSDDLIIGTILQPVPSYWADCVGEWSGTVWTAPNGVVNFVDVTAAVQYFASAPNAPHLTWVDVEPQEPNAVLNFADIQQIVYAFQGAKYPFGRPADCP